MTDINQPAPGLSIEDDTAIEKVQAKPKRGYVRRQVRETQVRETQVRDLVRDGPVEVEGRDGEILTRKRTGVGDIFEIPKNLIPDGWEYQWNAVAVVGNKEVLIDQNLQMHENGWRAVNHERYPGRYAEPGTKGPIIRGGQMLMERPSALCEEARQEDQRRAKEQVTVRNESLKLSGVNRNLPQGFEMNRRYRGTGGDIRMSIDPALDAPTPTHELE